MLGQGVPKGSERRPAGEEMVAAKAGVCVCGESTSVQMSAPMEIGRWRRLARAGRDDGGGGGEGGGSQDGAGDGGGGDGGGGDGGGGDGGGRDGADADVRVSE
eukprot:scaffold8008_cov34-Tisochrysis_lutea.AAC.5